MIFIYTRGWNSTRVYKVFMLATPVSQAWCLVPTVARKRFFLVTKYIFATTVYHPFKGRKRTITNLDIITVEQFVKLMRFSKIFTHQFSRRRIVQPTDLFILHVLGKKYEKHKKGLYCDDELACFEYSSCPKDARIGKDF